MTAQETSCQMMVGSPADATPCGATPTVGGNGLYRYCDKHMRICADAGATTLTWDVGRFRLTALREMRPSPISGWRRRRGLASHGAVASSVWLRRGVFLISALENAEYPDGSGVVGPQWHVSISRWANGETSLASDTECAQALACLGLSGAEQDNHEPGVAKHFWQPVDPARRVACECKASEQTIVEPDGHRWTTPKDEAQGCHYEAMVAKLGAFRRRPCPIHGAETERLRLFDEMRRVIP